MKFLEYLVPSVFLTENYVPEFLESILNEVLTNYTHKRTLLLDTQKKSECNRVTDHIYNLFFVYMNKFN